MLPKGARFRECPSCHPEIHLLLCYRTVKQDEQADMAELDDDEDDDHFDQNEEYDPEVWKGYTPEKFDEFKKLGLRFQNEEVRSSDKMANRHRSEHGVVRADHLLVFPCKSSYQ